MIQPGLKCTAPVTCSQCV